MTTYSIIACPDCDAKRIVKDKPEKVDCFSCGTTNTFRDLVIYHETEDKEEAHLVLGQANAGEEEKDEFIETVQDNPDKFRSTSKTNPTSQKEKILASVKHCEPATTQQIASYAQEQYSVPYDKTLKALKKLEQVGEVMIKRDGTVRKL